MDLQQFIEKYEKDATKVVLSIEAQNYLKQYREAILNPDFEEERQKALDTAKEMVVQQKKRLRNFISLNFDGDRLKGKYIGGTPPHLLDLKIYLEYKELLSLGENSKDENEGEKIPEKYYALYHWVLIEMGKEKAFEKNRITDRLDKPAIMKYGVNKYGFKTKGQVFYQTYKDTDITKREANARDFGKGYKEKLIEISNNDADVISHLRKYPN